GHRNLARSLCPLCPLPERHPSLRRTHNVALQLPRWSSCLCAGRTLSTHSDPARNKAPDLPVRCRPADRPRNFYVARRRTLCRVAGRIGL
ncbi:hypothetical protein, partial [Arthrobacter sp. DR-2P]